MARRVRFQTISILLWLMVLGAGGALTAGASESQAASAAGVAAMLARIEAYQAFDVDQGCVVNALLFRDWFRQSFPGQWSQRITIKLRGTQWHEVVLFEISGRLHVWDPSYGVSAVFARRESDSDAWVRQAATEACDASAARWPRILPDYRAIPANSSVARFLYERLKQQRPALVVAVGKYEVLLFRDAGMLNVFVPSVGTRLGYVANDLPAETALRRVLRLLFGDIDDYRLLAGELAVVANPRT